MQEYEPVLSELEVRHKIEARLSAYEEGDCSVRIAANGSDEEFFDELFSVSEIVAPSSICLLLSALLVCLDLRDEGEEELADKTEFTLLWLNKGWSRERKKIVEHAGQGVCESRIEIAMQAEVARMGKFHGDWNSADIDVVIPWLNLVRTWSLIVEDGYWKPLVDDAWDFWTRLRRLRA